MSISPDREELAVYNTGALSDQSSPGSFNLKDFSDDDDNSKDVDDGGDEKHGKNQDKDEKKKKTDPVSVHKKRLTFLTWYSLILMILMSIHQVLLVNKHVHMRRALGESIRDALFHGIPVYIFGIGLIVMLFSVCFKCNHSENDEYSFKTSHSVLNVIIVFLGINTLLFSTQTVVVMTTDVLLLMNNQTEITLVAARNLTPDITFRRFVNQQRQDEMIDVLADFRLMFLICEMAYILLIMRIPMWFVSRKILHDKTFRRQNTWVEREYNNNVEIVRNNYKVKSTKSTAFGRAGRALVKVHRLDLVKERKKSENKQRAEKRYRQDLKLISGLAMYGLNEGLDAFSFLEQFLDERDVWISEPEVTKCVLGFMSLNILLLNVFDCLSMYKPSKGTVYTKFTIVVINDLPLLVCRCVLLARHKEEMTQNLLFILFMIKEAFVVILAILELVVEYGIKD